MCFTEAAIQTIFLAAGILFYKPNDFRCGKNRLIQVVGEAWQNAPEWMDKNYLFKYNGAYYLSWGLFRLMHQANLQCFVMCRAKSQKSMVKGIVSKIYWR